MLLFDGASIFDLDYENDDPFYPTLDDIENNPERATEMGWEEYEPTEKVTLYTIVFQMFVFCQLFNQINARKLGEREFNVFENFFNNAMFIFILVLTLSV